MKANASDPDSVVIASSGVANDLQMTAAYSVSVFMTAELSADTESADKAASGNASGLGLEMTIESSGDTED